MKYTDSLKAMLTAALLTLNAGFAVGAESFTIMNSPWKWWKYQDGPCYLSASLKNGPKGLEYEIQVTKDDIVLHTVKKKHRKKHRNTEAQIISGSQSYDLFFGEKGEWAWLKDQAKYKKAVAALGKTPKIDTEFSSVIEFTPHGGAGLGRGLKLLKSKCK